MNALSGNRVVSPSRSRVVGIIVREGWIACVRVLVVKCAPCLVSDSTQPWSTVASKCVPRASGGLIICWVERGVRNQREVVMV